MIRCSHCNLNYDENIMIREKLDGEEKFFCCKGCQGVFHLLKSEGLDSFYEKLGKQNLKPPSERSEDLSKFDLDGFTKRYVKKKDGFNEISLIIEGIFCNACVWLNEKVLFQTEGIIEANVNGSSHKAKIVWDDDIIKLSEIILKIEAIGYKAYPYDPNLQETKANARQRDFYARLLVGIFATMNIMWIAVAQYAGYFTGMSRDVKDILNFAEFILATPTLFYSGWIFYKGAYFGLKNRFVNMDFLVATGATLTYMFSIYAMFSRQGEVYFDSVTMIITFVVAGKYLEVLAKKKAVDTLDSMTSSLPTEILVLRDDKKELIPIEAVKIGDVLEVKAGDKIVIDGKITKGCASFDEASLSGESEPILKEKDDEIMSGSICLDSVVQYKAISTLENSMLSKILNLLEDSMAKKPKIEQIANQISGYFSVGILFIAICTFIAWYVLGFGFSHSLIVSISVIVVACPCALGLATPVSTLVGLGVGAKRGILFKEATFLETMATCDTLLLDKTGTITEGRPKVLEFKKIKEFDENLLYSVAKSSSHPVSLAVLDYLKDKGLKEIELENLKVIEAKGIKATYDGKNLLGGGIRLLQEEGIKTPTLSNFYFCIDGEICAYFKLKDRVKDGAASLVSEVKKMGIKIIMLTGDNEKAAKEIANKLNIDEFYASLLPLQKAEFIDKLHKDGKKIVMVGDGINDTLALSKSDIAISMGSGADISINVSDIVLPSDSLFSLKDAFKLSKKTFSIIKQNLIFSLVYNLVAIPIATLGYIIPLFAALFMSASSLTVVLNSLRIKSILKERQ